MDSKADKCADCFIDKAFPDSSRSSIESPHVIAPNFSTLSVVSEDDVRKIRMQSPTKSCLIDAIPTFLLMVFSFIPSNRL